MEADEFKRQNEWFNKAAISQGYVPKGCTLDGMLIMGLVNESKDPCDGCNEDRGICNGRSKGIQTAF